MKLPEKVKPGEAIPAKLMNDLIDAVASRTLKTGPGYRVRNGRDGQWLVIEKSAGGGASVSGVSAGAFYTMISEGGDVYLQGGTVTGGSGTETAANIQVIDDGTPTQIAGTHMYVIATGDGVKSSDVLLPGWNLSTASIGYATSIPDNTLPTATSETGKLCHIDLGVFTATGFEPSGLGNIAIGFCLGSYSVARS